jgi:hypothetical protein
MAKIVIVHGVGKQFMGEETILRDWLPAMRDGLTRAGHKGLDDPDVKCAFYGDLFRPEGKAIGTPPWDYRDITEEWEKEFLELLVNETFRVEPELNFSAGEVKARTPGIIQAALLALCRSRFFSGIAENALIFDLKQVCRFFHEPGIRAEARQRVAAAIDENTRVIVAHSLGTVVAYEAMCADPHCPVNVFVTLGSPLGIPHLIFHQLDPKPGVPFGAWPGKIQEWVNIADKGDIVAMAKELKHSFGPRVEDQLVYNGAHAHDARNYLTAEETGYAIARGI